MNEPLNPGQHPRTLQPPPALPKRLLAMGPVMLTGTTGWFIAFIVLLVAGYDGVWLYTALSGVLLGFIGVPIMLWQRSASRRGVRSAQRNL